MNPVIAEFFADRNFQIHGNCGHGVLDGYETNFVFQFKRHGYPLSMLISFYVSDEDNDALLDILHNDPVEYCELERSPYGLALTVTAIDPVFIEENLDEWLSEILDVLKSNGALGVGSCPLCGAKLTNSCTQIDVDGFSVSVDADCANKIAAEENSQQEEQNNKPNNYLAGIFGAVVGSLAGAAVAVILGLLGLISSVSAIVAFALGCVLYQAFGGKPNKLMIVIVFVVTLVAILGTDLVMDIYFAKQALDSADISAWDAFVQMMSTQKEFANAVYIDLVLTGLFTIIACVCQIVRLSRNSQKKSHLR